MPIENLSDTTLTQSMVDKMFKLYDVKVSCQGNAKEISFKNILNGPKLKSNIDSLINKAPSLVSKAGRAKPAQIKGIYGEGIYKQATYVQNIARDSSFTAELSMDRKRVTGGLLLFLPVCVVLFPLLIIWLIMLIYSRIKMNYTKYLIKPNSIEEQYSFMASSSREFSNDKIMSIIFRESFIDKFFNTCDIEFLSIGSSQSIKFLAIKKTDGLYENILAKIGIKQQGIIYEITSDFTVLEMLKSKFFTSLFGGIILLTAIILLYLFKPILLLVLLVVLLSKVITIVYNHIYYKRSKLTFFKDSINFREGIFYKVSYNVLYDNIKDITTLQYPFSSLGKITINIAGEHIEQKDDGKVKVSNDISIQYVSNIQTKNELLDLILYKRPSINEISQIEQNIQAYTPKLILTAKPDQANTLAFLLITSIFIIPIFFLPLSIPISIMDVRRTSYIIQPYRLVARSGILYKKQISILFKNIDHISFNQGMFNKSFNNGSIIVNTTGSSTAEMVIANIPNFKGFYDELKRHY
ncbi:TPA: PH domain-containing protein [Candidatus Woesearchaeota archaeon]|nr:PH domain-containing protein [Candidatus Woesearchaeota archaeon]